MIAPAAPPTAAPTIAPRAVDPVALPTTPPTTAPPTPRRAVVPVALPTTPPPTAPPAAPITAPFSLFVFSVWQPLASIAATVNPPIIRDIAVDIRALLRCGVEHRERCMSNAESE